MVSALDMAFSYSYKRIMNVSVADAKNRLPELIKAVQEGHSVSICRRGKPVVYIVCTKQPAARKPTFGTLRTKLKEIDPDGWKSMPNTEVDDFLEGRN